MYAFPGMAGGGGGGGGDGEWYGYMGGRQNKTVSGYRCCHDVEIICVRTNDDTIS